MQSYADTTVPTSPTVTAAQNTPSGTVTVSGTGIVGSTVTVTYADGTTGSATVDSSGHYSVTSTTTQPSGTISVTDTFNGQTSAAAGIFVADTAAPQQATTIASINDGDTTAPHTGVVPNGGETANQAVTVSGTISSGLNASDGDVVEVFRNGVYLGNATTTGTTWTYVDSGLVNGTTYSYTAEVVDAAGNPGAVSNPYTVTEKTTQPVEATTITGVVDTVSSQLVPAGTVVANNGYTNSASPMVQGQVSQALNADETVAVYDGGVYLGNATVSGTSWTFTDTRNLADRTTVNYTAEVIDEAGNQGAALNAYTVHVDLSVPAITVSINAYSGADTTPTISGALTGALPAGNTLQVTLNGVTYVAGDGNLSVSGTTWTLHVPAANAMNVGGATDVPYSMSAVVVSAGGNLGVQTTATITVDGAGTIVNSPDYAYETSTTPAITGAAHMGAGETLTVTVTDSTGKVVDTFTNVAVSANGGWVIPGASYKTPLSAGTYTVSAAVNAADGAGGQVQLQTQTIDVQPQTVPVGVAASTASGIDNQAPSEIALSNGNYMVVYHSNARTGANSGSYDLIEQQYTANGIAVGGPV
ncbi:Ig-like domain-containing protein, partial [Paraburkholderia sediminicola]